MAFWNSTDEKNTFRTNYAAYTNGVGKMQAFLQKVNNSLPTMTKEEAQELSTYLGIMNVISDSFGKKLDECIQSLYTKLV